MAPVSIAQLECDCTTYADRTRFNSQYNRDMAAERLIAAMPAVLEVLKAAVKYSQSDGDDWYGQTVCTTVDRLLD